MNIDKEGWDGIVIDIERMQEALDSESRLMPNGLTKEQMRQWLIDFANEP